ncbi:MAG: hypothetical protein J5I94_27195 [Phaeodactylibacter sp.]|nr:hypothetical protein [Phaeodactylibacter sp.]
MDHHFFLRPQLHQVHAGGFYLTNKGAELECLPGSPGYQALILFLTEELMDDVRRCTLQEDRQLPDGLHADAQPVRFLEHVYRNPLTPRLQSLARQMQIEQAPSRYTLPPDVFYALAKQLLFFRKDTADRIARTRAQAPALIMERYTAGLFNP